MSNRSIGVIGATSLVGDRLLSSSDSDVTDNKYDFIAFTRRSSTTDLRDGIDIYWRMLNNHDDGGAFDTIEDFICLAPIWTLSEHFSLLESYGVKRIVVLSSTSRFTKQDSSSSDERDIAIRLKDGENQLIRWAESRGIEWIILRPTLIYGYGRDKNITAIASFIKRFGFFPLLGPARGLRQPIHADDVAQACLRVLLKKDVVNKSYNISGAEILSYREMVERIFSVLGKKKRIISIPSIIFRSIVMFLSYTHLYRKLSVGMLDRMSADLVFEHSKATEAFGFNPEKFYLNKFDFE